MFGRLLPELYALPTPAMPSAASSRIVRMNPVIRLTRLATAMDPLLASRPRVLASTGSAGTTGGAASTGGAVPVAGSGTTAASGAAPAGAASVGGAVSSGAGASITAV